MMFHKYCQHDTLIIYLFLFLPRNETVLFLSFDIILSTKDGQFEEFLEKISHIQMNV